MGEAEAARRTAVVTGGEGDLGQAVARTLRGEGWDVRAPGRGDLDVTDGDMVKAFFADLERCDLLVNNAGVAEDASALRMGEAAWDRVMEVNLRGAARCCRAATRLMVRQGGGHILNIGSLSAARGTVGQANYAAAKAALIGLGKALAQELGSCEIRVNTVLPGFLETRMTAALSEKVADAARAEHVLGRFNTVDEAARFIAFLAGMHHVSGQVFQLDSRVRSWV